MVEFKLTINDVKTGKSYQKAITTEMFKNKKIGDVVKGDDIGLSGYELMITGGSDKSGFPMYRHLKILGRKKILLSKEHGIKERKTVRGNLIGTDIAQINLKVVKDGEKKLGDIFGKENTKQE